MIRLIFVIAIVTILWWFLFRFSRGSTTQQKQVLIKFLLYSLAAALLVMVITGRAHWIFALVGAAIPWLQRLMVLKQAWHTFKRSPTSSPSSAGTSKVRSKFIEMRLDHDSGEMNGVVLNGEYKGRELADLDLLPLMSLLAQYNADRDSQNLLKAYLDFRFGDEWHEHAKGEHKYHDNIPSAQMTRSEALAILGMDETASIEEIALAHKKLMQKIHPDRGGSEYLASKINQAKDFLLG